MCRSTSICQTQFLADLSRVIIAGALLGNTCDTIAGTLLGNTCDTIAGTNLGEGGWGTTGGTTNGATVSGAIGATLSLHGGPGGIRHRLCHC